MTGRATGYARRLAGAVREQLRARYAEAGTGMRWRRPARVCPPWCSPARCSAHLRVPGAEHRSDPVTWRTPYGVLIVSLAETVGGRTSVELRVDVRLDDHAHLARAQASHLAVSVDLVVRAVLADIGRGVAQVPGRTPDRLDVWLARIAFEAGTPAAVTSERERR